MKSRVEALILNILGEQEELSPPLSRIEEILYSILNDTAYIKDPLSRIEAIVLAIKEKDEYTRNALSRIEEILKAVLDGTNNYDKLPQSDIERDLIRFLGEWVTKTGDIVTFTTDQVVPPFQRCEVELKPIQDLHGQEYPYPAGGGVNKFDKSTTVAGKWLNISTGLEENADSEYKLSDYIPVKANTTYTMSTTNSSRRWLYDSSKNPVEAITNATFNPTADGYCRITIYAVNPTYIDTFMVVEGSAIPATYSPYSNLCPISGRSEVSVTRTGKNLVDDSIKTVSGYALLIGSTDNNTYPYYYKAGTYSMTIFRNTTNRVYGYVRKDDGSDNIIVIENSNKETPTGTITLTESGYYRVWLYGGNGAVVDGSVSSVMLVEGSTPASSYEPYQAQTVTLQLGQTVYGGTVDVTSGKMVIDRYMWVLTNPLVSVNSTSGDNVTYDISLETNSKPNGVNYSYASNRFSGSIPAGTPGRGVLVANHLYLVIAKSELSSYDRAGLLSWLSTNTTQICYTLATPTEVTLTPEEIHALLGNNCVWSDAGKITVTYHS